MTLTPDETKLVERLQGFVDACSGHDITLYEGHPAVLVAEAASALIRIAEERAEARALNNKYAWERDKAREERDAAERRSEAHWKPRFEAALRERDEAREALRIAEAVLRNADPFSTTDCDRIPETTTGEAAALARRALSEQPDKERT